MKPTRLTLADRMEPHLQEVIAWRSAGGTLDDVAINLKPFGIQADRAAVFRFLKKKGLPTGRMPKPEPQPFLESVPPTPPMTAAKHDPLPSATPVPSLVMPPRVETFEVIVPPPIRMPDPILLPTPLAPQPAVVPEPKPVQSSQEQLVAKMLVELDERQRAVEVAKQSGDPLKLRQALEAGQAWLASRSKDLSPEIRGAFQRALDHVNALLAVHERHTSAPLFTPLPRAPVWTLDTPLISLGEQDAWTLGDALEGTLILGATGSGKTSGSGATIAQAFLGAHFGGLVLTAKEDEAQLWQRYAERTDRLEQLCVIRPGGPFKFNFLDYQASLPEAAGGSTENVVELLYAIMEAHTKDKRSGETFWANTSRQLFRNLIRIMRAAKERLNLRTFRRFVAECPQSGRAAREGDWKESETFGRLIAAAKASSGGKPSLDVEEAILYWTMDFPALCDETRSIIVMDLVSMLDVFFDPVVWDLFCGETNITPEAAFDGAVIVVDLPIKRMMAVGRISQVIWKHLFQVVVERRKDSDDATRRPLMLWVDEAQNFWAEHDGLFQATARSSRCATVCLTQSLPNYYVQAGRDLPHERVDGFLACLCTKVFHANNDPSTNEWAATQVGKTMQYRATVSSGEEPHGRKTFWEWFKPTASRTSVSPQMDFEIQPSEFMTLRTGGSRFDRQVEAVVLKSGARFSTGRHYLKASFTQETRA